MTAVGNHKLALLYMMRELLNKTDDDHTLNATQLISVLEGYNCQADRRTIYSNVRVLQDFGIDVIKAEGNSGGYYIGSRDFELPELKLLVDAVQSSKFITAKKTQELIGKIEKLTNEQKARELNRAVFIRNRRKAGNETIYYNVDGIHEAMNANRQVTFRYAEWTPAKKLVPKRGGQLYRVSPWALTWDDENYYLIAHEDDGSGGHIRHYRVDKMLDLTVSDGARVGQEAFKDFDLASFAKKTFGMYGGRDESVVLRCENSLAGVVLDRFGSDVMLMPGRDEDKGHFTVRLMISVSPQFFGWITGIGPGMQIVSPENVREEYLEYLDSIYGLYD